MLCSFICLSVFVLSFLCLSCEIFPHVSYFFEPRVRFFKKFLIYAEAKFSLFCLIPALCCFYFVCLPVSCFCFAVFPLFVCLCVWRQWCSRVFFFFVIFCRFAFREDLPACFYFITFQRDADPRPSTPPPYPGAAPRKGRLMFCLVFVCVGRWVG